MKQATPTPPPWSTAAFGTSADTSPMELDALSGHLQRCTVRRSGAQAMHFAAGSLLRFVLGRSVTSVVLLVLLLSAAASVAA